MKLQKSTLNKFQQALSAMTTIVNNEMLSQEKIHELSESQNFDIINRNTNINDTYFRNCYFIKFHRYDLVIAIRNLFIVIACKLIDNISISFTNNDPVIIDITMKYINNLSLSNI